MTPKEVIPKVQQDLFTMQDLKYRDFHAKTDANSRERISDRSESSCTSNLCKEIREDRRGEAVS